MPAFNCETTDMVLVHRAVYLFTSLILMTFNLPAEDGQAEESIVAGYLRVCCEQVPYCFGGVCLCVCPHKISKTTDLKSMQLGICPMVNAKSGWRLITFDLDF